MKKPVLWVCAGIAMVGAAWAFWPNDERAVNSRLEDRSTPAPGPDRSLAQRLGDEVFAASDAGRGLVFGTVEDQDGHPVAGAEVRVFASGSYGLEAAICPVCSAPILECTDLQTAHEIIEVVRSGKAQRRPIAIGTSGPDGTFTFEDLPQEALDLSATKGSLFGSGFFSPDEEEPAVVRLFARSVLSLLVLRGERDAEKRGVPLGGAKVTAISLDTFQMIETVSDAVGLVGLDRLDDGNGVWVRVEAPGLSPSQQTVHSGLEPLEVTLSPTHSVVVRTAIGGKPAEAMVTLKCEGGHPAGQQTHAGTTRFDGLGSDSCTVTATTDSLVSRNEGVTFEHQLETVDLELRAAAKLSVTVIDESGDPVADAEVTASGRGGETYSAEATQGALMVLGPMGDGPVTLDVTSSDFRQWHRELDLHPGENTLEVVVKRGVKVRGKVVDSEGKPVAQAEVEARAPLTPLEQVSSEDDGTFELTFDEPGLQQLTAFSNAVGRTTVRVTAPADGVVIRLEARARVTVLVHEGRAAIVAATVTVTNSADRTALNSETGPDGVATISGLESGSYQVAVQAEDYRDAPPLKITLIEGQHFKADVQLDHGLSVSGVVVDERGAPVSGAELRSEPWISHPTMNSKGEFTLSSLDPEVAYRLEASTALEYSQPQTFKGPQSLIKVVMLPRLRTSGRVLDAVTDAPVTHFEVDGTQVDTVDGRFSAPLRGNGEGNAVISIRAEGYDELNWQGTWEASRDMGTVKLKKATVVEGTVRDVGGNPVSGARVQCDNSGDEVTSAGDGTFRLSLSLSMPDTVLKAQRGQNRGSAPMAVGRPTDIVLKPATHVNGKVVDGLGRPVSGMVTLRDASSDQELDAEAALDGTFAIDAAQGQWVFITRVSTSGQTFAVSGPSMRVVLGVPPGSCAISLQAAVAPDELILLPGDAVPPPEASFEQLAATEGAVLFDTLNAPRMLNAAGFRCGTYTAVARWADSQRVQRVELHTGASVQLHLQLPVSPGIGAAEPPDSR